MRVPRPQWHVGRTVGVTIYKGDAKSDMVGVMVGPHAEACELAAFVVHRVNTHADLLAACDALFVLAMQDAEALRAAGVVDAPEARAGVLTEAATAITRARWETPR